MGLGLGLELRLGLGLGLRLRLYARCRPPLRAPGQPPTAARWRRRCTRAARPRRIRASRRAAPSGSPRTAAARPVRPPCSSWPTAARTAGGRPKRRSAKKGKARVSCARGLGAITGPGAIGRGRGRTAAGWLTGENLSLSSSAAPPPGEALLGRRPPSMPTVRGETTTTSVETESMLEERRSHTGGGGRGLVPSRANLAAGGAAPSPLPCSLKSMCRIRCGEAPRLPQAMRRLGVISGDVLNFISSAAASTALCVRLMRAALGLTEPSGWALVWWAIHPASSICSQHSSRVARYHPGRRARPCPARFGPPDRPLPACYHPSHRSPTRSERARGGCLVGSVGRRGGRRARP